MPLPTMSLRAPPEHHQIIRDIATALRTRPELEAALRDVLHTQHVGVTERDTDALQSFQELLQAFQERLMIQSNGLRTVEALAEGINERVKVLEQPEALRDTDGNTNVLQSILDRLSALEQTTARRRSKRPARPPVSAPDHDASEE